MQYKIKVGILGATGMVGQRLITLLAQHPWFEIVCVAASPRSAGMKYGDSVDGRWKMNIPIPKNVMDLTVFAIDTDFDKICADVDFVFCALDLEKEKIAEIELRYAAADIPVISSNSAHRFTPDVPMIIPEVNPEHAALIDIQRKKRGFKKGFIAVKPNCSIQSYVGILTALSDFEPTRVEVVSLQAISGAGKTFETWPEMVDNLIPYIGDEEEKSEKEPMKIWGKINEGELILAKNPTISATCIRVPVSNGHMARVAVSFGKRPSEMEIISHVTDFKNPLEGLDLPSAPKKFIQYFSDRNRPQTQLDRDYEQGMGISMGRLKKDSFFDYTFISLSHNTIRGAAGGAVLMAEFLTKKGYITGQTS